MSGVQPQRSNPPRMFTTDDEAYGQELLSFMFPRCMGAKAAVNTVVWPLALLTAHGLLECPGHWPAAKVTQVERAVVAVFGSVTLRSS